MATLSLDAISAKILLDTFRQSLNDNGFVDALSYRAEHEDWIEKLNELEQRQFLKRDGNSYRVTFVVLTLIDDEQVAVERSRCKRLFAILRDHYKNSTTRNQEKRLKFLSDELELSYEQTSLTVRYFMDVSPLWHAGSSIDLSNPESAYVIPSESIITCKSFDDLVEKVQRWFLPSPFQPVANAQILASLAMHEAFRPQQIRSDLNPAPIVTSYLYELNSDAIARIVGRVGLSVAWTLTKEEAYSEKTRVRAYRPRIEAALRDLGEAERMLVARNLVHELIREEPERTNLLNDALGRIGWQIIGGELTTHHLNIREAFFPSGAEHTAYVQIRAIFGGAKRSIDIIDPYLDSSVFMMLKAQSVGIRQVRLLTAKAPPDFLLEARKFQNEVSEINLEIRTTREFHDRFVVLDDVKCFHVGASIKDAGKKACMISELEDGVIVASLVAFTKEKWDQATRLL